MNARINVMARAQAVLEAFAQVHPDLEWSVTIPPNKAIATVRGSSEGADRFLMFITQGGTRSIDLSIEKGLAVSQDASETLHAGKHNTTQKQKEKA